MEGRGSVRVLRKPYYQDRRFRLRMAMRSMAHVVMFILAFQVIGFASYWLMGGCAAEAQCTGNCKSYRCSSSLDCGLSCDCVRINDTWYGTCVENW